MSPQMADITCSCCRLPQRVRDRIGALPTVCDVCHYHQADNLEARLARAESHEEMLRERLAACRNSEQLARDARERARDGTAAALRNRGRLAARIVEVAEEAGKHRCAAVDIGRDPRVIELAEDYWQRGGR